MKTFFDSMYYVLVVAIVALALLLSSTFLPIPGNFQIKIVKSGSMEPAIMTGSIVVIKPEASYQVGDVITFGPDTKTQVPTTHRIVAISSGADPVYTTKGDANDASDPSITHLSDIHGMVLFTIPYLGYILAFARTTLGFALLIGVPALAIIFDEISKIIREVRDMRRKKQPGKARSMPERQQEASLRTRNIYGPQTHKLSRVVDLRGR